MSEHDATALSHPSYWDTRYSTSTSTSTTSPSNNNNNPDSTPATHEWFRSYADLEPFFTKTLFSHPRFRPAANPSILHLGSGDSTIPLSLSQRGYTRQTCIDFSPVLVRQMRARHSPHGDTITWVQADVRRMPTIPSRSATIAFDKGTLDAMVYGDPWDPPREVRRDVGLYLGEVWRVLERGGVWVYVTYRQTHFVRVLLGVGGEEGEEGEEEEEEDQEEERGKKEKGKENGEDKDEKKGKGRRWVVEDVQNLGEGGGAFGYFGWVLRKIDPPAEEEGEGGGGREGAGQQMKDDGGACLRC